MKYYEVEMIMSFTKTIHVKAPNEEAAEALAEIIFKDTDVMDLTTADLDEFITYAVPVDGSDDDDNEECDITGIEFDEDEELPFDGESAPGNRRVDDFLNALDHVLDAISDHEVHIHILP